MVEIGLRKIQNNNGGFYLCLPKFWARSNGIEKGDQVRVGLLSDGSIRISIKEAE